MSFRRAGKLLSSCRKMESPTPLRGGYIKARSYKGKEKTTTKEKRRRMREMSRG